MLKQWKFIKNEDVPHYSLKGESTGEEWIVFTKGQ